MRKIIKHLKDNWIRHGFETLVVVVGVLIAFTLNNWNETQKIKAAEQALLSSLNKEFRYNLNELERVMNINDQNIQEAKGISAFIGQSKAA